MSDINLNAGMPQVPGYTTPAGAEEDIKAGAAVTAEQAVAAMNDLAALFAKNVTISKVAGQNGTTREIAVPALDDPDEALAADADLEVLIAYLQMEMDETQAEAAKDRINSSKAQLDSAHKTQMDKIQKSIDEAKKQEKAAKAQRALSWIGAIFAVAAAVVITVCTGGAAAGFAIAGAVVAVGALVLSETGADKKIMDAMSKSIQKDFGCSKQTADAWSQGIFGGVMLVLSLSCAIGGGAAGSGKALVSMASTTAKVVKTATSVTGSVVSVAGMGTSAASMATGYKAGMANAEVTENQAVLVKLQKMLEENEEDLQKVLQLLNDSMSSLMELLETKIETEKKIVSEMGQMA